MARMTRAQNAELRRAIFVTCPKALRSDTDTGYRRSRAGTTRHYTRAKITALFWCPATVSPPSSDMLHNAHCSMAVGVTWKTVA
jgi:hypothetical protein